MIASVHSPLYVKWTCWSGVDSTYCPLSWEGGKTLFLSKQVPSENGENMKMNTCSRNGKPFCLICQASLAHFKASDIQRHFSSLHANIDQELPKVTELC